MAARRIAERGTGTAGTCFIVSPTLGTHRRRRTLQLHKERGSQSVRSYLLGMNNHFEQTQLGYVSMRFLPTNTRNRPPQLIPAMKTRRTSFPRSRHSSALFLVRNEKNPGERLARSHFPRGTTE